jgi:hypothetical protein
MIASLYQRGSVALASFFTLRFSWMARCTLCCKLLTIGSGTTSIFRSGIFPRVARRWVGWHFPLHLSAANPVCGGNVRWPSRLTQPVKNCLAVRRKPLTNKDDFTALLARLAKQRGRWCRRATSRSIGRPRISIILGGSTIVTKRHHRLSSMSMNSHP